MGTSRNLAASHSLPWAAIAASALVAALVYAPTLRFHFIWDDSRWLKEALPALTTPGALLFPPRDVADFGQYYRPLTTTFWWLLAWLGGGLPFPFHLAEILLHAACAGLVATFAFRLLDGARGAALGALAAGVVFAAHPVHVEAVAWVGPVNEILAAGCMLVSLVAYDAARRSGAAGSYAVALVFAFLAFASKESALILPLLAALLELRARMQRSAAVRAIRRVAGFGVPLALYLALRRLALGAWLFSSGIGTIERRSFAVLPGSVLYYIARLFSPDEGCHLVYQAPASGWESAVLLALLAVVVAALIAIGWRRNFALAYGAMWTVLALVPPLSVAVYGFAKTPVAERYLYSPTIGLALIAGAAVASDSRWRRAITTIVLALAGVSAALAVAHLAPFASDQSFWTSASRCASGHCLPWINLGDAEQASDLAAAEALYERALELPCDDPDRGLGLTHRAVIQYRRGQLDAAVQSLLAAEPLAPGYSVAPYLLARIAIGRATDAGREGDLQRQREQFTRAKQKLDAALALRPAEAEYHYAAGQVEYFLGNHAAARRLLLEGLELDPQHDASEPARTLLAQPAMQPAATPP